MCFGPQRHVNDCLVRTAGPEEYCIDGIRRSLRPHKTQGCGDITAARRIADLMKNLRGQIGRLLSASSERCLNAQAELIVCYLRKKLLAELRTQDQNNEHGNQDVTAANHPRDPCRVIQPRVQPFSKGVETPSA